MARRCGCASGSCSCVVTGGDGVEVSGSGSTSDPYVIDAADVALTGKLQVQDSDTIDLTLAGEGTVAEPYILTADAALSLGQLVDVDDANTTVGYVLARMPDGTFALVPPTTAPVGAINSDATIDGDGSAGDPLRVHDYDRIVFWSQSGDIRPTPGSIYLGDPADDRAHAYVLRREAAGAPSPSYQASYGLLAGGTAGHSLALTLRDEAGTELNVLRMLPDGTIARRDGGSGNYWPMPYRQRSGFGQVTFNSSFTASIAVTFPAGLFTQSPTVVGQITSTLGAGTTATGRHLTALRIHTISPTGFTATAYRDPDAPAATGTVQFCWQAEQQAP